MSQPHLLADILQDYFANSNEPLAVAFREHFGITSLVPNPVNPSEPNPDNFQLSDWIDNQDVMQLLHISLRTLQKFRTNGTLPYTKVNGKIYYRRQDVEALLNKNYRRRKGQW